LPAIGKTAAMTDGERRLGHRNRGTTQQNPEIEFIENPVGTEKTISKERAEDSSAAGGSQA
jgi:hypothetical protein